MRDELAGRLGMDAVGRFMIRSHVYSPSSAAPREASAADPFLIELRSPSRARVAYHAIKRGVDVAGSSGAAPAPVSGFLRDRCAGEADLTGPDPVPADPDRPDGESPSRC